MQDTNTMVNALKEKNSQTVSISALSIAKATLTVVLIIALVYFLYSVKNLLILFCISLFFASALSPIIDFLEKYRIHRGVGVILVYFFIAFILLFILGSMLPALTSQIISLLTKLSQWTIEFFTNLPQHPYFQYIPEQYRDFLLQSIDSINLQDIAKQIVDNLSTILQQVKDLASGGVKQIGSAVGAVGGITAFIAENVFNMFLVFMLTFFMVVDQNNLHNFFLSLFPKRHGEYIAQKISAIQKQIGAWLRGQILLSFIMFVLTFLGLLVIGIREYALTLALVMAVGDFIPYVGPMIFFIFALPVAIGHGFTVVIAFLIFYVLLQFAEGNIIVPIVMKKAVGLSPIVVIIVLLVGFQFLGIIGAIIAVPLTTAFAIFLTDYTQAIKDK
jgi:predicted PurR-regulated permease PerM